MSWAWTDTTDLLSGGPYSFALYGTNAICGKNGSPVYYSSNGGQNWTQNESELENMDTFAIDGTNGVACISDSSGIPIYYTTDSGVTWTAGVGGEGFTDGLTNGVAIYGTTAIAARGNGIWASSDGGATWTRTQTGVNAVSVAMASSSNAIVSTNVLGTYYTDDGGLTWQMGSETSFLNKLAFAGVYALASGSGQGIYYSTNSGQTWQQSQITTETYNVAVNSLGQGTASSSSAGNGILYTTNGNVWNSSNLTASGSSFVLSMTSTGALAGSTSGLLGIYFSVDGGATWQMSFNVNDGTIASIALSGNNAITSLNLAGNNGIAYSTGPLCFHRDTLVLCEGDQYRPIHELGVGDRVLTHRHGLVPIKHIASTELVNGLYNQESSFLYRHRTIPGLMLSGEHRLLIDPKAFHPRARAAQKRLHGLDANLAENKVDGLLMRMACFHPEFERVEERAVFPMYHLVLEHNNEPMRHYGIFVNGGVVAETCHEAGFHGMHKAQME